MKATNRNKQKLNSNVFNVSNAILSQSNRYSIDIVIGLHSMAQYMKIEYLSNRMNRIKTFSL